MRATPRLIGGNIAYIKEVDMPARKPRELLLLNGRGNGKDSAGYPVPLSPPFKRMAPNPPSRLSGRRKQNGGVLFPNWKGTT